MFGCSIFNKFGEIKKSYKLPKGAIYKTPKDQYHLTIPISKKLYIMNIDLEHLIEKQIVFSHIGTPKLKKIE